MKKLLFAVLALCAAILGAPFIFPPGSSQPATQAISMPWQIDVLPDGKSRVFGLTLGSSPLDEATARFGDAPQLAVVAASGQAGTMEAYFDHVSLGVLTGKIIVVAEMPDSQLLDIQKRAQKTEPQESGNRRFSLSAEDRLAASQAPVRTITFVPAAKLDAQVVQDRFGRPGERLAVGEVEHFLYAEKGLDLALSKEGKAVLQYVAPARFAGLREPLLHAATAPAPAPAK